MDEITIGIFKFQSDFALEVWFSKCWEITVSEMHKIAYAIRDFMTREQNGCAQS